MSTAVWRRRTAVARAGPDGSLDVEQLGIDVAPRDCGAELRSRAGACADGLATAAHGARRAIEPSIRAADRARLRVECGVLAVSSPRGRARRTWTLATCGPQLLGLHAGLSWRAAEQADTAARTLDRQASVVLSPSVLLMLLTCADGVTPPSAVTVVRSLRSPYPPHDHLLGVPAGLDAAPELAHLLEASGGVQPLGALGPPAAGGVRVSVKPAPEGPRAIARLDAITPGDGGAVFAAVWRGVDGPPTVRLDPGGLLSRISGALGPPAPAYTADPFTGPRFGVAPSCLTDLTAGELAT